MMTRRKFFRALFAGSAMLCCSDVFASKNALEEVASIMLGKKPGAAERSISRGFLDEKKLSMQNIHTGESLNIHYYSDGVYDLEAIGRINYFLRCHYTDEVKEIDIGLLDLLCDIKDKIGHDKTIQIISGYRSDIYNHFLMSQGRNVSKNSLHLQGMAIDFAMEGIHTSTISQIAKSFEAGGVGQYPEFVHIDVGRVRYW